MNEMLKQAECFLSFPKTTNFIVTFQKQDYKMATYEGLEPLLVAFATICLLTVSHVSCQKLGPCDGCILLRGWGNDIGFGCNNHNWTYGKLPPCVGTPIPDYTIFHV